MAKDAKTYFGIERYAGVSREIRGISQPRIDIEFLEIIYGARKNLSIIIVVAGIHIRIRKIDQTIFPGKLI
jgi:hypothetical protein